MAAYTPVANQTFGFNDPQVQTISKQYGFTPAQLSGLQQGKAGQPTPTLALGNTGFNLTMGAGGGNYMVSGPKGAANAPMNLGSSGMTSVTNYGGQGGSTSKTPAGTPGSGPTIQTSFRNALIGQLGQDPNKVALTDPDLAPQVQAFSNAQQRSQGRAQQELAEQGFAGGTGNTGAYGAELNAMEQQRGESEAQFEANLLAQAKQQRTANLFQSLGLGQQQIQGDEALQLQKLLGMSDIDLRRLLGMSDIDLRRQLGQGQLGLGLLQTLLGDRQANNQLGLNAGIAGMGFNQSAVTNLLNMFGGGGG